MNESLTFRFSVYNARTRKNETSPYPGYTTVEDLNAAIARVTTTLLNRGQRRISLQVITEVRLVDAEKSADTATQVPF